MFWPCTRIRIRVKLFTGLHKEVGIEMDVPTGARIRTVAKRLGLPTGDQVAFFVAGERAGRWHNLRDGDELAFMKPSAGG